VIRTNPPPHPFAAGIAALVDIAETYPAEVEAARILRQCREALAEQPAA
jgi:hypothetical protein